MDLPITPSSSTVKPLLTLTQTEHGARVQVGHFHIDGVQVPTARYTDVSTFPDQLVTVVTKRDRLKNIESLHARTLAIQHEMSVGIDGIAVIVCKTLKPLFLCGSFKLAPKHGKLFLELELS